MTSGWKFWVDRGGTFTDVVAQSPFGKLTTHKFLSENPDLYPDAVTYGIGQILADQGLDASTAKIDEVKMGTTVATNALLERKGERTALVITMGFADALRIGYQSRPNIFARQIVLPSQLYESVVEIDERISAQGEIVRPLNENVLRQALTEVKGRGIEGVAIVCLHGYRFPAHEDRAAAIAKELGFRQISVSHEVAPLIKLVGRGDTTVVDAYLSPILSRYVKSVGDYLGESTALSFMQSNGGLAPADRFRGKDAILSGPAGGIVGMTKTAGASGFSELIGFDMGGTSTDVSHYAGSLERANETNVAGVRLRVPMLSIHTIAAGGGSICRFESGRLRVGPQSAGADPGPACYGRGGPITITDCNVHLGKIHPFFFPKLFGKDGKQSIDVDVVEKKLDAIVDRLASEGRARPSTQELAQAFLEIAVEDMANAIKKVSVAKGQDIGGYTLVCFGGAAGQHACLVADALGMKRVMIHPFAGVLSAYGMGLAEERFLRQTSVERPLVESTMPLLVDLFERLEAEARSASTSQHPIAIERRVFLRYRGTDTSLPVQWSDLSDMAEEFSRIHLKRFSFVTANVPLVVEAIELESVATGLAVNAGLSAPESAVTGKAARSVSTHFRGGVRKTPVFDREKLALGQIIEGPAIIFDRSATTAVEPEWRARLVEDGSLILDRATPLVAHRAFGTSADPFLIELFNSAFMAIAEQMGSALQNTAHSVNIKERLDFSCALFDASGSLIANAPHMPVHLGSMGDSVRAIMKGAELNSRAMRPGDVFAQNNPYNGGTHLPDITVVMPVFLSSGEWPAMFVAARGHHADIGGITPGSMPPQSKTLDQEGLLLDNFLLVEGGRLREEEFRQLLNSGPYPARNPDQNLGDIRAQIAACAQGGRELQLLVQKYGEATVAAYMGHVQDNAERAVRTLLGGLGSGSFVYQNDDGSHIAVSIYVNQMERTAVVDFSGTSEQQSSNMNAPSSVCRAAVLYVVRTLLDEDIPINDGCLRPIEIRIPDRSMLKPEWPAAVVAGNVETSQVVTDALFGAVGAMAAAQGTMNNFTFGNDAYQYYETICGGSGAGPDFDGTDAVHTHMTNSRLTDPEVLELRFPVAVEEFRIRRNSGGSGKRRGGDGVVRKIRALEPMEASILSNRRRIAPFGLAGGSTGTTGRNYVERKSGEIEDLEATGTVSLDAGDAFVIETPGGGGFGN